MSSTDCLHFLRKFFRRKISTSVNVRLRRPFKFSWWANETAQPSGLGCARYQTSCMLELWVSSPIRGIFVRIHNMVLSYGQGHLYLYLIPVVSPFAWNYLDRDSPQTLIRESRWIHSGESVLMVRSVILRTGRGFQVPVSECIPLYLLSNSGTESCPVEQAKSNYEARLKQNIKSILLIFMLYGSLASEGYTDCRNSSFMEQTDSDAAVHCTVHSTS